MYAGATRACKRASSRSSDRSTISTTQMKRILEKLKALRNRRSTINHYHQIWKQFNDFVIRLDVKPSSWECRTALFCAYLVEKGNKSETLKSYVSAIKNVLLVDGYKWDDSLIVLETITKACRLLNDTVLNRFPIHIGMLEMILFEIQRMFPEDIYRELLFKTIFIVSYYGMLRISEAVTDFQNRHSLDHAVKAVNVHIGQNKPKMMLVLYSSKTHGKESRPQKVKISALNEKSYVRSK